LSEHDLPPVLDIEIEDHVDSETLQTRALQWLELVEKATGKTPVVYSSLDFAESHLTDSRFSSIRSGSLTMNTLGLPHRL